jgi:hypothetical protein
MKYLPLIWSGIWRKPGRAILILLQVLIASLLFGRVGGGCTVRKLTRSELRLVDENDFRRARFRQRQVNPVLHQLLAAHRGFFPGVDESNAIGL